MYFLKTKQLENAIELSEDSIMKYEVQYSSYGLSKISKTMILY